MKNINDYKGAFTAIKCENQEEWNAIAAMDWNPIVKLIAGIRFYSKGYKYICLNSGGGMHAKQDLIDLNGFVILRATDFLPAEREVIGYRFNELGKNNVEAINAIMGHRHNPPLPIHNHDDKPIHNFDWNSPYCTRLSDAGVLDIWCEPVYAEVKPKHEVGEWIYAEDRERSWVFKFSGLSDNGDFKWSHNVAWLGVVFEEVCQLGNEMPKEYVKGRATPEQLLSHLSKAADVLGYKEGVRIESLRGNGDVGFSKLASTVIESGVFVYLGSAVFDLNTCEWAKTIKPKPDPITEVLDKFEQFISDLRKEYGK